MARRFNFSDIISVLKNSTLFSKTERQALLSIIFLLAFIFTPLFLLHADTGKQPLTFRDIMAFKSIRDAFISEDGQWVVYHVQPDRGAGEAVVYNIESRKATILRPAENPKMTADSRWVAAAVDPGKRKPKITMVLLDTSTGKHMTFQDVKSFEFSPNSQWLIYRLNSSGRDREQTPESGESGETGESRENNIDNDSDKIKTPLLIEFGDNDGVVPWTQGIELRGEKQLNCYISH